MEATPKSHTPSAPPDKERPTWLKIRVTPQERERFRHLAKSLDMDMSTLVRRSVFEGPPAKIQRADPELIKQLVLIGNNINQIARSCNLQNVIGAAIDLIKLNVLLKNILEEVKKCLPR
jgi:hypothetical protein